MFCRLIFFTPKAAKHGLELMGATISSGHTDPTKVEFATPS
jgi:hypothetical protein